jgi:hypothetical protein
MEPQPERDDGPEPEAQLVARVNMIPEDELDLPDNGHDGAPPPDAISATDSLADTWPVKAIPLGLLALVVIVIAMILVLQGVFEMIPD